MVKLIRKVIGYTALGCLYLMGYCKGYNDSKNNQNALENFYLEHKKEAVEELEKMADGAYFALKKLIKDERGE